MITGLNTKKNTYAFGMPMPGRSYQSSSGYRYGMNGQEKDLEIFEGAMTAEYWEYDSRTGRRFENDPIVKPWESPYATFGNNPISFIDPFGLEKGDPVKPGDADGPKGSKAPNGGTKNGDGSISDGDAVCIGCGDKGEDTYGIPEDKPKDNSSPSSGNNNGGFFADFYGMSKYAGDDNPYMYNRKELNTAANMEFAIVTSFIPGGQYAGLGKIGGFMLTGTINSSIDYLAQKATGQKVNLTSVGGSFIFQGGLGSILTKNFISSGAQLYYEDGKLNHKIIGIDHKDFGAVFYNAGMGSAFDYGFFKASSLNIKINTRYTTRLQNLSTKPKYAMELMHYRSTIFYKSLLKNSTGSNVSDFGNGVIQNSLESDLK